jgi:hypothetical protein
MILTFIKENYCNHQGRIREELIEILEEWKLIRLRKNLDLPVIYGIDLRITDEAKVFDNYLY